MIVRTSKSMAAVCPSLQHLQIIEFAIGNKDLGIP